MNKNFPPKNGHHGCAVDCPDSDPISSVECEKVCGEYAFTGPATIYSFNTLTPQPVFQLVDGELYPVGTFGGKTPFQREFKICGEYVIQWCIQGEMPDCEVEEPVFHVSCNTVAASPQTVCLKKKDSDEPVFHGWSYACANCGDPALQVSLFTSDGQTELSLDEYQIVSCC